MEYVPNRKLQQNQEDNFWNGVWFIAIVVVICVPAMLYAIQVIFGIPTFSVILGDVPSKMRDKRPKIDETAFAEAVFDADSRREDGCILPDVDLTSIDPAAAILDHISTPLAGIEITPFGANVATGNVEDISLPFSDSFFFADVAGTSAPGIATFGKSALGAATSCSNARDVATLSPSNIATLGNVAGGEAPVDSILRMG